MSDALFRALPPAKAPVRDLYAGMNGTERDRAVELEAMRRSGRIAGWWFESITLLLAPDCRYTPDFVVQELDGTLRMEETKGFWRDDARVKIRLASTLFPFRFSALRKRAKKAGGGWDVEEIRAA